jgi:hypothetical protein
MSAKTKDSRPISRSSGSPLNDRRAVVGSSGRPERGMIIDSGAKQIGSILGTVYRPEKGQNKLTTSGGMKFDVDAMKDKSIGRLDESSGGPTPGED